MRNTHSDLHEVSAGYFVKMHREVSRRLAFLPAGRRKSLKQLFESPKDYVLLSLRQAAGKLAVDPSTLLRNLRALGFKNYPEFRRYLHERAVAFATSSEPPDFRPHGSGINGLIESALECDLRNLRELQGSLDPALVITVAKKISAARRLIILAGDMSVSLGSFLSYTLTMLGFNPTLASTPGEMVHRVRSVDRQDVIFAITYRRGLVYTVDALNEAYRKNAYCVGISDSRLSPIAEICHSFFVTPTDFVSFADSYTSAMTLINAIIAATAAQGSKTIGPLIEEAAREQRTGRRFYLRNNK